MKYSNQSTFPLEHWYREGRRCKKFSEYLLLPTYFKSFSFWTLFLEDYVCRYKKIAKNRKKLFKTAFKNS